MNKSRLNQMGSLLGLVLTLLFAAAPIASSQPDPPGEETSQQEPILVGRISHVEGQLLRYVPSDKDWVAVVKDAPFGLDDVLYSNEKGKAEFIMPNNTWVRIDGETQVQMIRLEEDLTEMDVTSGTARFYNKISTGLIKATTPFGYVVAGSETTFDLYVDDKSVEVIALKGKVDFVHPSGNVEYEVREGSPSLLADGAQIASGEGGTDPEWDGWNSMRDELWTKRLQAAEPSKQYLPPCLHDEAWALEENGVWERVYYEGSYRYFWRPIYVVPGWAPFTVGRWIEWCDDQCWVPDEPFGYLTHHYGNWVWIGGLWYWAPPVVGVEVHIGLPLPPPPPLPLLPIPFAWFPGRVCWIHSSLHVGWVPLAPFEPYYCHRHWGPHSIIVDHRDRPHVDHSRCRHIDHAVVIHRDHLYRVNSYQPVRIRNLDQNSLAHDYHGAPVVDDTVIRDYKRDKKKYQLTNAPVPQKPHRAVLKRIKENEEIASRQETERENAQAIRNRLGKVRQDEPRRAGRIEGPKVSNKLVPEKEANRPETEIRLPEKALKKKAEAKSYIGQPPRRAKPEQPAESERKIRPPQPGQSGAVQPRRPEDQATPPGKIVLPARPIQSKEIEPAQPAQRRKIGRARPIQSKRDAPGQKPSEQKQALQQRSQGQPGQQGQLEMRAAPRPNELKQQYWAGQGNQVRHHSQLQSHRGRGDQQYRGMPQNWSKRGGRSSHRH